MATAGSRWNVVMSRNAGFSDQVILHFTLYVFAWLLIFTWILSSALGDWRFSLQVVELDFLYPSEGIHRRWDSGYRITSTAATWDQAAFVLSVPRRKPADETQETLRTSAFPSSHVKVSCCLRLLRCTCNRSVGLIRKLVYKFSPANEMFLSLTGEMV